MKNLLKFVLSIALLLSICTSLVAQTNQLPIGNYIVVAAYSVNREAYAKNYMSELNSRDQEAEYGFSLSKNLYFVYLSKIDDFDQAVADMQRLRRSGEFTDAWVFVNKTGPVNLPSNQDVKEEDDNTANVDESGTESNSSESTNLQNEVTSDQNEETTAEVETDDNSDAVLSEEVQEVTELDQIGVKINLFNLRTGKELNGSIELVDTERAKRIRKFKSGDVVTISNPDNGTGKMSLIVDNFGFRRQQKEINYFNPLSDTSKIDINFKEGTYEVDFDLIRYGVGDIVVMYNVAFFKDAAVMRPESKFEVNSLIDMMLENDNLKIRIHGHVNGKHPGKLISKGDEPDYYTLSDLNKEGVGSAKELSKQRAEAIRDLLVEQGINLDRMDIKAWGGKRMIHDKNSTQADENVRVEIEILDN